MVVRGSAWRAAIWTSRRSTPASSIVVTYVWRSMCGCMRATRRLHHFADHAGIRVARMHPHMLRHTYVTTMFDAGVDLRDVQIAARHADPRTTMRYDRARTTLDRHPTYILAAYMSSGT